MLPPRKVALWPSNPRDRLADLLLGAATERADPVLPKGHRMHPSLPERHNLPNGVLHGVRLGGDLAQYALHLCDVGRGHGSGSDLQARHGGLHGEKGLLDDFPLGVHALDEWRRAPASPIP